MGVSTGARASGNAIDPTAGEDESVSEQVSREVFTTYECRSINRGIVHPGDIAEPSSLRYARQHGDLNQTSQIGVLQRDVEAWSDACDRT
jgi:hypothetical protein